MGVNSSCGDPFAIYLYICQSLCHHFKLILCSVSIISPYIWGRICNFFKELQASLHLSQISFPPCNTTCFAGQSTLHQAQKEDEYCFQISLSREMSVAFRSLSYEKELTVALSLAPFTVSWGFKLCGLAVNIGEDVKKVGDGLTPILPYCSLLNQLSSCQFFTIFES